MTQPIDIAAADYDAAVRKHGGLVLVDFHAHWCAPCRAISRTLEELAIDYEDILFLKVDIDANPELARRFNIRGVPTLILVRAGEQLTTINARTKSGIAGALDDHS